MPIICVEGFKTILKTEIASVLDIRDFKLIKKVRYDMYFFVPKPLVYDSHLQIKSYQLPNPHIFIQISLKYMFNPM